MNAYEETETVTSQEQIDAAYLAWFLENNQMNMCEYEYV